LIFFGVMYGIDLCKQCGTMQRLRYVFGYGSLFYMRPSSTWNLLLHGRDTGMQRLCKIQGKRQMRIVRRVLRGVSLRFLL
jgi:hypothetical protein